MGISGKKVRVIIPARGGSKGVPGKNIRDLAGKPLLLWSIEDAKESKYVDEIYVSTDDAKIAQVAMLGGAQVIDRPMILATDKSKSEDAIIHALSVWEGVEADKEIIVFMQCTSPIRTGVEIDEAIEKFVTLEADSLLSVSEFHGFLWETKDKLAVPLNYDYKFRPMRQDIKNCYKENGSFYIFKPWVLEKTKNRLGGKIVLYEMNQAASLDIDTEFDFKLAESFINYTP
ncbi:acylneuraminate cytidylyltransferase family protein [Leptospira borgpetersenii]|uniref:acylneuraminate cytidylyltransferase family protein n=1 Tax=Leptospira borgpetersenii TaxID=174 RepID=UPI000297DC3A|nr:acylneuraminate cytidylyltransferase family protein [Leptospira borgpetersenii]EMO10143.1 cytidylyltransferase [Leptospira borgpetersenii str. Noumea 25]EKQ99105.1 cytidylyltransferase [Leptospira borgpetersenii serovar Castellonis str. 200801910]KGE21981.1 acylneuraminate cytidylyltransferase [Leptospira borgpetersenii serovar Ballum]MBE8159759.1 acylneuraminate cytidylyltransferase family protein [Leptospira borgpetersenii serovar Ballum]MBE8164219.1 acylneuraminate cytidylyltransferase f